MKKALFAILTGVALLAPGEALAHGNHHRGNHHVHGHGDNNKPWARRECHYHPNKGFWHCHRRRRGHGEPMRGNHQPNFGIHFIIPFQ